MGRASSIYAILVTAVCWFVIGGRCNTFEGRKRARRKAIHARSIFGFAAACQHQCVFAHLYHIGARALAAYYYVTWVASHSGYRGGTDFYPSSTDRRHQLPGIVRTATAHVSSNNVGLPIGTRTPCPHEDSAGHWLPAIFKPMYILVLKV